jgi:hypothetical protein
MPGQGRPADPLWFAIGMIICIIPGIGFHQLGLGITFGFVVGGALGLIREDKRRGYHRPADPLWFAIGLLIGLAVGVSLHFLGLTWRLGLGLGFALGVFLGAVAGTIRADRLKEKDRENQELAKRYRNS